MSELIVVGMRFQDEAYKSCKINRDSVVFLALEPENKVNSNAIAVYSKDPKSLTFLKIGYIRDADLNKVSKAHFEYQWTGKRIHKSLYAVDRVCQNYLRLVKRVGSVPDHITGMYGGPNYTYTSPRLEKEFYNDPWVAHQYGPNPYRDIFADTRANADKYFCDSSNGPMTYEDHDRMVQEQDRLDKEARLQEAELNKYPKIKEAVEDNLKKEKKMINTNAMRDSFFKEVKNVAMDMQTGKLGVVTKDGIITATLDGVSVNPITEMGFNIPAFAMRVPVEQLTKGDIIISSGDPVFFVEGSKVGYMTITTTGVIQETGSVANMFFGKNTVMAVKNMFGNEGEAGAGGMNPMMLAMVMGDSKDGSGGFDFKKMMMLQMMMGGGNTPGGMGGMNPMMMAMMFADKL
jgi:hypothetical protein